ncbi:unnamed protein product [Adineta steineri]|uniref:Uncharacterized protein n=1 Tax=Adineta steineri TaxID=433720 RepID=A0A815EZ52_9BILA|nr:unnamed protein product [Adineta steineri]CAF1318111.1 unnamed protein product [Adineta steineri]
MACNSAEIEQFNSSFWIERQWSFEHLHGWTKNWDNRIFYSNNPYRRKYFTLYGETGQLEKKIHLNTVLHVHIRSLQAIINCIYYFPRVTKITFEHIFDISQDSIATSLNCIIPLKQITKLVVNCHCFSFEQIIQILYLTSNLCIMILKSIYLSIPDYWSLQQNENFQRVSKTNRITNITIEEKCKLIDIRLLVALCPRLEHLTIHIPTDVFQLTIRFLLSKTNENIRRLFSLCLTHESKSLVETLKTFIESEKLLDNYFLEFFEDKLYLYW